MKNSNGSGSISKLKGKRRKPWYVRATIEFSSDGKQIRKSIGTFATKREAQEALYLTLSVFTSILLKIFWIYGGVRTLKELHKKQL